MTDWIEHDGGPQPVADDVWVRRGWAPNGGRTGPADMFDWDRKCHFLVLNQHLIDAALLEGIRLGLEAAVRTLWEHEDWEDVIDATELIREIIPETIAREAVLDKLASDAQAQGMGYDPNVHYGVKVVRPQMFAPLTEKEADQ